MKQFEKCALKKRHALEEVARHLYSAWPNQISEIVIKPEDSYGHHWTVECRARNLAWYFCPACLTEFEFLSPDLVNHVPLCGYCGTPLLEDNYARKG